MVPPHSHICLSELDNARYGKSAHHGGMEGQTTPSGPIDRYGGGSLNNQNDSENIQSGLRADLLSRIAV
jgi:hypothetical protein